MTIGRRTDQLGVSAGEEPRLMSITRRRSLGFLVLRRYLFVMALGNLAWEFAHMPLYTLWQTGTAREIIVAALHCTGGDVLIAFSSLAAALLLFGRGAWPQAGYWKVAAPAIAFGIAYTLFSEWVNVQVRETWVYGDLMPITPVIGTGLSPLAQWVLLPSFAFCWAGRALARP
jgi:hypothetical protein